MKIIFRGMSSSIWLDMEISMPRYGDSGLYECSYSLINNYNWSYISSKSRTFGGACSYIHLSIADNDHYHFYRSYDFRSFE